MLQKQKARPRDGLWKSLYAPPTSVIASVQWDWGYNGYKGPTALTSVIAPVHWGWGYDGYKRPSVLGWEVSLHPRPGRGSLRDQGGRLSQRGLLWTLAHTEGPLEQGSTGKGLRVCAAGLEANGGAPGRDADGDEGEAGKGGPPTPKFHRDCLVSLDDALQAKSPWTGVKKPVGPLPGPRGELQADKG